jgi:hypothetical protein
MTLDLESVIAIILSIIALRWGGEMLWTGRLTLGRKGRPGWNLVTIGSFRAIGVHPIVARVCGLLIVGLGVLLLITVVRRYLG